MGASSKPVVASALSLLLTACQASSDVVSWSYGDLDPDPNHPPYVLAIDGDISVTDPSMFSWEGTYYVFSSGSKGSGLDLRSTKDLEREKFRRVDDFFPTNPRWVTDLLPNATDLWSPFVLAWNGTIHLYYAASWYAATVACIGHATTSSMDKAFVDDGEPLLCSNLDTVDPFVAIDPTVILDEAGAPWMVFGSWGDGINIIPLNHHGRRLDPQGSPIVLAARAPGEVESIQAASIYRWRDFYYLFVSHDIAPDHVLRVGRSAQITGPYVDRDGNRMDAGGGTLVLQGDDTFRGPGSNMVFDDGNQRLNVYHSYNASDEVRLRIGQLFFDQEGWPVSAGP